MAGFYAFLVAGAGISLLMIALSKNLSFTILLLMAKVYRSRPAGQAHPEFGGPSHYLNGPGDVFWRFL